MEKDFFRLWARFASLMARFASLMARFASLMARFASLMARLKLGLYHLVARLKARFRAFSILRASSVIQGFQFTKSNRGKMIKS